MLNTTNITSEMYNYGMLFVYRYNLSGVDNILQIYIDTLGGTFQRISIDRGQTWRYTWQHFDDIPAFYKDYANLNDLFSALGDINRLYGETFLETDLNAAADGLREFGTDTQNSPIPNNYGMVFTSSLDWSTNRRFCRLQICVNQLCSVFYFRICWNGTWSAWNNLMQ